MAYPVLRSRGLLTSSAVALSLAFLAPAQAQTAAPGQSDDNVPESTVANDPQSDQAEEAAPDIVVTGSRIRVTPGFDTPNPVVSLSAETIQSSGTTNLTDFLTSYPALQGSSSSADNSGSGAGIGFTGLNLLDLRNLGTERTLVLVDGRRHVAGVPGSAAVDINTIPNDLVQRVEVLTGGASAIYGADGVTGVVNFILKKDFEGLTARAQAGISEYGDAGQRLISVTAGKNFADGRGNFALAYEYASEDRLQERDRKRLSGTERTGFYLNPDDPENQSGYTGGATNGIPDYVPLKDVRYYDTNREGGIDVNADGFPDYFVGFGGGLTAFDPGRFVPNFYQQGGNGTSISDYVNDLLPDVRRHVANAIAHFDVSDKLTIFAEGKYANTRSYSLGQPTYDYYLLTQPDNPFLPAGALAANQAATAAGACDDPDTGDLEGCEILVNRDNFDLGRRGEDITRETWRGVIGVRGALSSHLNYEASYTYGRTDVTSRYIGDILDDRFYAAIDVVQGPNGPTCRANVQPGWSPNQPYNSTRDAFDPTTFAPGECVPLNIFGENLNSQASLDWIRTNTTDRARIEQHVASAYLSGDLGGLFTLPGGAVGFSLGAEYRKEKSRFVPDAIAAQGLTFTNALTTDAGEYDVKEVFGEVRIPLIRNGFVHQLELGGAVRYSDYSTIGSTTSWKVDGSFAPIRDITFTGTYSKAVRAPNIGELFSGLSQTFEFITDPCNTNELANGTQYRAANCATLLGGLGADAATFRDTRSSNIPGFQGGNADLRQEEATTWTVGAILQPRFVPGLSLRADWYDIRLENAINTVAPEQIAQLCVDQPTLDNVFCGGIVRQNGGATPGFITGFTVTPQNVAEFRTAGLDVNLNYQLRTDNAGTFNLAVVGNYLNRLEFIGTPGAETTNRRQENLYRAPKYTVTADLTWQKGPVTLNYGVQWFDKTLRFTNLEVSGNDDIVAPEYFWLKQRWQHDVYASFDVNDQFQFYGGVNNVFGQRPDIGTTTYPVSSVGRFGFVGARMKL
jgi:outer membrane receptor protein involved in Fe transport